MQDKKPSGHQVSKVWPSVLFLYFTLTLTHTHTHTHKYTDTQTQTHRHTHHWLTKSMHQISCRMRETTFGPQVITGSNCQLPSPLAMLAKSQGTCWWELQSDNIWTSNGLLVYRRKHLLFQMKLSSRIPHCSFVSSVFVNLCLMLLIITKYFYNDVIVWMIPQTSNWNTFKAVSYTHLTLPTKA